MSKLASQFENRIKVGYISRHGVLHTLNTTVMRSLSYPLPVITITKEECAHIMAPILNSVLATMKIVRTITRDVLYGPVHLQGMSLKNLYTQLGVIHCAFMVQFYGIDTDLGCLL